MLAQKSPSDLLNKLQQRQRLPLVVVGGLWLSTGLLPAQAQNQPPVQRPTQPNATTAINNPGANQPRFRCESNNGRYTVMYYPENRPNQGFAWATPGTMGGGWSPERRCLEISRRLEQYRPDGLVEMRTSVENRQNIVCATTDRVSGCRIIFTVPPGQDPIVTRDRVFQNLLTADSGGPTQPIATFAPTNGGRPSGIRGWLDQGISILGAEPESGRRAISPFKEDGINLKPFLSPADGGTGNGLGIPNEPTGRRFNRNF